MSKVSAHILCGACRCDITGPDDHTDSSVFHCPQCGRSDTHADIIEEVQAYFTDSTARALDLKLQEMTRGSSFMKVTQKFDPPQREYRWIASELPGL